MALLELWGCDMAETLNARLRRGLGGAQRFIFGEGAPDTYEGLQAKRQMAARLGEIRWARPG